VKKVLRITKVLAVVEISLPQEIKPIWTCPKQCWVDHA